MHRISIEEKVIHIKGHAVRLQKKKIKSLRLRLIPPHGEIRLSVPSWYSEKKAEQFVLSRIEWIEEQKRTIKTVHSLTRQTYKEGNSILYRGEPVTLKIQTGSKSSTPTLIDGSLFITEKRETTEDQRKHKIETWYRNQLKLHATPVILLWAQRMNVTPQDWRIRKMNTRWGTCNIRTRRIWLNLELITMKPEILEYVIVHELAHLIERGHNKRFKSILSLYLPEWKQLSRNLQGGIPL